MPHFIFIQQISVLNILNMLYNLHFFSSKCRLFHNATLFVFCITHILNTGSAKIWKKKSVAKRLIQGRTNSGWINLIIWHLIFLDPPYIIIPRHPPGTYNFDMAPKFFKTLYTPGLINYKLYRNGRGLVWGTVTWFGLMERRNSIIVNTACVLAQIRRQYFTSTNQKHLSLVSM